MTTAPRAIALWVFLLVAAVLLAARAQFFGGGRAHRGYEIRDPELIREQDEMQKAIDPKFSEDVFTFARLKFAGSESFRFGGGRNWDDDTPQADLSLTWRLYQVTSLKVRAGLNYVDITTKDLANYPFVYAAAGGRLELTEDEISALHTYLLSGGFLMVDDFWGDDEWQHFYEQIKRVFPDREPVELSLDNRIFHTVFDFKQEPQIPSVGAFLSDGQSYDPGWPYSEKTHEPHYYALYDDNQRMMAIICHNNHYGDGWEHETDDHAYFDRFSEPQAYPMFINILVYAMTH